MSGIVGHRGLLFGLPVSSVYVIEMDFDAGNGSTTMTDTGSGGSTWTANAGAQCSTGVILAGVSSLQLVNNFSYVSAPYTSANQIPATADWDIEFLASSSSWTDGGTGVYLLSVQDGGSITAAGTAFAIATSSSGNVVFVISDGTTRSVLFVTAASPATGTSLQWSVQRRGSTITLYIDGSNVGSGTFAGSINFPSGRVWRIGTPEFAAPCPPGAYLDTLRVRRY